MVAALSVPVWLAADAAAGCSAVAVAAAAADDGGGDVAGDHTPDLADAKSVMEGAAKTGGKHAAVYAT